MGAAFQGGEADFEVVDAVAEEGYLGFEADFAFGAALDAGGLGGALDDGVEGDEALGAVGAVDEAGLDLTVAVPGAQGRAGDPGLGLGLGERDPGGVIELGEEVEFVLPLGEAVLPLGSHRVTLSLIVH